VSASEQLPAPSLNVTVHDSLPPLAVTSTWPPGVPAGEETLTATVTSWPGAEGSGSLAVIVVVVAAASGSGSGSGTGVAVAPRQLLVGRFCASARSASIASPIPAPAR
jgi:hypothetical protein